MIKRDTDFAAIELDADGTIRFILENAEGTYEELPAYHDALERCLAFMESEARQRFGPDTNGEFVLEIRLLEEPDVRMGGIIHNINENELCEAGGRVEGTPWPFLPQRMIPKVTPPKYA